MVVNEMITNDMPEAFVYRKTEEQYMIAQKVFTRNECPWSFRKKLVKNLHKPENRKTENKSLEVIYQNIEEKLKESSNQGIHIPLKENGKSR